MRLGCTIIDAYINVLTVKCACRVQAVLITECDHSSQCVGYGGQFSATIIIIYDCIPEAVNHTDQFPDSIKIFSSLVGVLQIRPGFVSTIGEDPCIIKYKTLVHSFIVE
ncbi:hypothetical protein D3C73_1300970 [compost metagenome]